MKNNIQKPIQSEVKKPSFFDNFKSVVYRACVYFTCLVLLLLSVQMLSADEGMAKFVEPSRFMMLLPFSFAVALADMAWRLDKAKTSIKLLIHFVVFVSAFYIFLYLPVQSKQNPDNPIIVLALLSIAYFIVASVILIIRSAIKKQKDSKTPYTPVYASVRSSKSKKN